MALEVTAIGASRACMSHVQTRLSFKEKLNSPTSKASKLIKISRSTKTPSSSSSYSSFSPPKISQKGRPSVICKARNTTDEVLEVTEATWPKLVVESDKPVLVDFWAPWCGPCRMIAPVIDELSKEYAGKIVCYKLNTDDSPGIASQYGIRSIPTVLFFKSGEKKASIIGAVPKSTLTDTIEKYLDK